MVCCSVVMLHTQCMFTFLSQMAAVVGTAHHGSAQSCMVQHIGFSPGADLCASRRLQRQVRR